MFGLDTNVLVRFLLRDDQLQAEQANKAIEDALAEGNPVVVSLLTMMETEWVLRSCAKLDKKVVIHAFRMLLESRDLQIEQDEVLEESLYLYESHNADFADCLMAAKYSRLGCEAMLTFDLNASKLPGIKLLPVQ